MTRSDQGLSILLALACPAKGGIRTGALPVSTNTLLAVGIVIVAAPFLLQRFANPNWYKNQTERQRTLYNAISGHQYTTSSGI